MRCTIFTFLALAIFFATPAFSQVKQWTDKNGVVHFEAVGRQGATNTKPPQTKTNARRPIDRNFATLSLGDDESPFTAAKKGVQIANNGDGAIFIVTRAHCLRERTIWEFSSIPADWR